MHFRFAAQPIEEGSGYSLNYDYAQMDHGQSSILCPRRTEKVCGEVRPFIAGLVFYLSV